MLWTEHEAGLAVTAAREIQEGGLPVWCSTLGAHLTIDRLPSTDPPPANTDASAFPREALVLTLTWRAATGTDALVRRPVCTVSAFVYPMHRLPGSSLARPPRGWTVADAVAQAAEALFAQGGREVMRDLGLHP